VVVIPVVLFLRPGEILQLAWLTITKLQDVTLWEPAWFNEPWSVVLLRFKVWRWFGDLTIRLGFQVTLLWDAVINENRGNQWGCMASSTATDH
jgi:hypothetical protein